MDAADINTKLTDSYISLLRNMSTQNKLDLISKLTNTVKADIEQGKSDFYLAFGGWDEDESADELIDTIKRARTFNKTIEEL